jgi:PTS system nitrogen regulatory IIA component
MAPIHASASGTGGPPDAAGRLRRIATLVQPHSILLHVDLRDRRDAVEAAAAEIARLRSLDPAPIARALWRREQSLSTALGSGVAVPHARIGGIDHPMTVFIRPRHAIDFEAPDDKRVGCILSLFVPADGDPDDHVQMLAVVARMFSDRRFRRAIAHADSVPEVQDAFAEWVERSDTA